MKKEICEKCKWYDGISAKESRERPLTTQDGNRIDYNAVKDGICWRYPEYRAVWLNHFCGEFRRKLKLWLIKSSKK